MIFFDCKFLPENDSIWVAVVAVNLDRFAAFKGTGVGESSAENFDQFRALAFLAGEYNVNSLRHIRLSS